MTLQKAHTGFSLDLQYYKSVETVWKGYSLFVRSGEQISSKCLVLSLALPSIYKNYLTLGIGQNEVRGTLKPKI